MRRIGAIAILALAILVSSFTLTSATAARQDTLRFTSVSHQFKELDLGKKGVSIGDQVVFSDNVFHRRSGDRAGYLDGSCTTTRVGRRALHQQCLVSLTLEDGQLTSQGAIRFTGPDDTRFTIAVTGGTGSYSDASGEAHVRFLSDTRSRIRVELN